MKGSAGSFFCRKILTGFAWKGVDGKKRASIDRATTSLAKKIVRRYGKGKPGIKTRVFFFVMHLMQRKGFNESDARYWKEKGWTGSKRPW